MCGRRIRVFFVSPPPIPCAALVMSLDLLCLLNLLKISCGSTGVLLYNHIDVEAKVNVQSCYLSFRTAAQYCRKAILKAALWSRCFYTHSAFVPDSPYTGAHSLFRYNDGTLLCATLSEVLHQVSVQRHRSALLLGFARHLVVFR